LGYVTDEFILVLKSDVVAPRARATSAGGLHVGDARFDSLSDRFRVSEIARQFPGSERGASSALETLSTYLKVHVGLGSLEEAMSAFGSHPWVQRVEPIGIHSLYAQPNDPQFATDQWYAHQASDLDLHAPEAWDLETGDSTVIVAIIDSGTRYYHPDLGGANASAFNPGAARGNMWINAAELNGIAGADDDNNGYVDDWIGYDFVARAEHCWPGEDCDVPDNDPRDFYGHGTHTAGIVGMLTNDGYGMAGVAGGWGDGGPTVIGDGARVMALRAGYAYDDQGQEHGVVTMDAVAEALYYAARNGARIACCSFGSSNSGGLDAAVSYFIAQGGLIFVAAGNDGTETADYLNGRGDCISVAATDEFDRPASFTRYGNWVNLSAPGVRIAATDHDHTRPDVDLWAFRSGTSMAAPLAAGTAALIWSHFPNWTASQVRSRLYASADVIDSGLSAPYVGKMGAGRVNAFKSIDMGAAPSEVIPRVFRLTQNYPNPFNPSTTIGFSLAAAGRIDLAIYNVIGQKVAQIALAWYDEGPHEILWDARGLPSGVYFCRLKSGKDVTTRSMMLLK
jgi:subtilisin family serine protease